MVSIAEVERLLQPRGLQKLACVTLIGRDSFTQSQVVRVLLVVASPDEISGVPLVEEFGYRAASKERPVVQVRSDERQHLSLVGFASYGSFNEDVTDRRRGLGRQLRRSEKTERTAKEIAPFHRELLLFASGERYVYCNMIQFVQ